jgi:hypothetical protein
MGEQALEAGGTMYQILRLIIAAVVVIVAGFTIGATAQVATQIMLTQKHVEGFIAVQKDMSEVLETMQRTALSDLANSNYKAKL